MLVEIIKGNDIIDEIKKLLEKQADEKIVVFGLIDDEGYNIFEKSIENNRPCVYLSVGRKCTTKAMLNKLVRTGNAFIYNNNESVELKNSNLVVIKQGEKLEAIISTFDFFENTIRNTGDVALKVCDEDGKLRNLYESYTKSNSYIALSEELIESLGKNKQLRNDKAATLTQNLNKDEVIKSFRTIGQVENKDEYLKMLEIKNDIKRSKLDASEVFYAEAETDISISNGIDNIEIDIEI